MYVRPAFRGRSLGRQLVQTTLQYARERPGIKLLQLTVTQTNAPAVALYKSCGFIPFALEPMAVAIGSGYLSKLHMWRRVDPTE
jgi:ribosomal protein S18 acetylase RimI-like enzyme